MEANSSTINWGKGSSINGDAGNFIQTTLAPDNPTHTPTAKRLDESQDVLEPISKFLNAMLTLRMTNQMASGLFSNPIASMGQFALLAPFLTNLIAGGHANCVIPATQVPPPAQARPNQSRVEELNQINARKRDIHSEAAAVMKSAGLSVVKDPDSASSGKKADFRSRIRHLQDQKSSASDSVLEAKKDYDIRKQKEATRELAITKMKLKVFSDAQVKAEGKKEEERKEIFEQAERTVREIDRKMDLLYEAQDAKSILSNGLVRIMGRKRRNDSAGDAVTGAEDAIRSYLREQGFDEGSIDTELVEAKEAKEIEKEFVTRRFLKQMGIGR